MSEDRDDIIEGEIVENNIVNLPAEKDEPFGLDSIRSLMDKSYSRLNRIANNLDNMETILTDEQRFRDMSDAMRAKVFQAVVHRERITSTLIIQMLATANKNDQIKLLMATLFGSAGKGKEVQPLTKDQKTVVAFLKTVMDEQLVPSNKEIIDE